MHLGKYLIYAVMSRLKFCHNLRIFSAKFAIFQVCSQSIRARELKFLEKLHLPPPFMCHVSHVTCNVSYVTCHLSCVTRFFWTLLVEGLLSKGLPHLVHILTCYFLLLFWKKKKKKKAWKLWKPIHTKAISLLRPRNVFIEQLWIVNVFWTGQLFCQWRTSKSQEMDRKSLRLLMVKRDIHEIWMNILVPCGIEISLNK